MIVLIEEKLMPMNERHGAPAALVGFEVAGRRPHLRKILRHLPARLQPLYDKRRHARLRPVVREDARGKRLKERQL